MPNEVTKQIDKFIFSKRFLKYRYYWVVFLTLPMAIDIANDQTLPNPVVETKAIKKHEKMLEKELYPYKVINREDWDVIQKFKIINHN